MSRYCLSILILLVLSLFLLASPALAIDPLVPCGGEGQPLCTTCDFLVLGKNVSDFILVYLVPALAALFFIYAGFEILLGGGIPARVAKGRAIFQTTAYGIAIIFLAWLIVNTVIRTVAQDENIAEHWWELECRETISSIVTPTITPTITPTGNNTQAQATNCGDFNLVCSDTARSCPSYGTDRTVSAGRTNWSYLIPAVAGEHPVPGVNTAKLLDSIMRIETSGIMDQVSRSSPPSCGLMQFQPATANIYKDRCGINHTVTCDWLRGKDLRSGETLETVAKSSICMAAEYFKAIKSSSCYANDREEPKDLAAGYNGGDGCDQDNPRGNALALSVSCSDRTTADPKYNLSCSSNRSTLRYECLWSNLSHTACNTGFVETRDYVAKFNSCYN